MDVQGVDTTLLWRHGPVQSDHDVQRVATHATRDLLRNEDATIWELKPKLLHMTILHESTTTQSRLEPGAKTRLHDNDATQSRLEPDTNGD